MNYSFQSVGPPPPYPYPPPGVGGYPPPPTGYGGPVPQSAAATYQHPTTGYPPVGEISLIL